MTLTFCTGMDHDQSSAGIEGQGQRYMLNCNSQSQRSKRGQWDLDLKSRKDRGLDRQNVAGVDAILRWCGLYTVVVDSAAAAAAAAARRYLSSAASSSVSVSPVHLS